MKEIAGQVSVEITRTGICQSCREVKGLTVIGNCAKCQAAILFKLINPYGLRFEPVSNRNFPA